MILQLYDFIFNNPNFLRLFLFLFIFYNFTQIIIIMNLEDFKVYFWSYIGESTVSLYDRYDLNKDFCDSVCFDAFRVYEQSGKENMSIDTICKLSENILFNVKRYKPLLNG